MPHALPQHLRRVAFATCLLGCATIAGALGNGGAGALPGPVCTATTCTLTFASPEVGDTWTVPSGITAETVTAYGAIGGSSGTNTGGDGAQVVATLNLAAGTVVTVDVGGAGTDGGTGGTNGGGASDLGTGGGGSDLKVGGVDQLAAGGGGGAGNTEGENVATQCATSGNPTGGDGGNAGSAGGDAGALIVGTAPAVTLNPGGAGGAGGTASGGVGGAAGTASADTDCNGATVGGAAGSDGSANQGGTGGLTGPDGILGGGGGGGYFGGGGGGGASSDPAGNFPGYPGGGGGSSFPAVDLVTNEGNVANIDGTGSINGGNGEVSITYALASTTTTTSATTTTTTGALTTTTVATQALAVTGADLTPLVGAAVALLVVGGMLLGASFVAGRRRRSTSG